MSILEDYTFFKKGIVREGVSESWQQLYKTNMTEEQVFLLHKISKENRRKNLVLNLCFLIAGVYIGVIIACTFFVFGW